MTVVDIQWGDLLEHLGLGDWTIYISGAAPAGEDSLAEVSTHGQQHEATISFSPDFLKLPIRRQQYVLLHELAHVTQHRLFDLWRDTLPVSLKGAKKRLLRAVLHQACESQADLLARAWLKTIPKKIWQTVEVKTA